MEQQFRKLDVIFFVVLFPLLCEKSGAILLVLVGLTAGRHAGQQSDEILVDLKIFKSLLIVLLGFSQSLTKV